MNARPKIEADSGCMMNMDDIPAVADVLALLDAEKNKAKKLLIFPKYVHSLIIKFRCKKSALIKLPPLIPPEDPIEVLPWSDYEIAHEEAKQEFNKNVTEVYKRRFGPIKGKKMWKDLAPSYFEDAPSPKRPEKMDVVITKPTICPVCKEKYEPGVCMIQCDTCDQWYHFVCGLVFEIPGKEDPWYCSPCLEKQ